MDSPQQKKKDFVRRNSDPQILPRPCILPLNFRVKRVVLPNFVGILGDLGHLFVCFLKHLKHVCAHRVKQQCTLPPSMSLNNVVQTSYWKQQICFRKPPSKCRNSTTNSFSIRSFLSDLCYVFQPAFMWIPLYYLKVYYFSLIYLLCT